MSAYNKRIERLAERLGSIEKAKAHLAQKQRDLRNKKKSLTTTLAKAKTKNEMKEIINNFIDNESDGKFNPMFVTKKINQLKDIENKTQFTSYLLNNSKINPNNLTKFTNQLFIIYKSLFNKPWKGNNLEWIRDTKQVYDDIISKYEKNTTRYSKFRAIYVILDQLDGYEKETQAYKDYYTKFIMKYHEDRKKNKLTDKQKNKLISYNKLIEYEATGSVQDRFLFYLIISIPRRPNALCNLKYYGENGIDSNDENYIVKYNGAYKMVLNKYKTVKKFGKVILNLNSVCSYWFDELINQTNLMVGDYIFKTNSGKQFLVNNFGRYLSSVLFNITDRKLTATDIRIIYSSSINVRKMTVMQMEQHQKLLGHDMSQSFLYKKIDLID